MILDYPDRAAFRREIPRLIVEHNLHGIDIDPRAAQIAGLSLWLRAQRAWHQAAVVPTDRPRITRSNVVCAEPMPGENELLREFVEQQFPAGERPAFAFLLEKIFDRMTLAGEAGSLLRIEEEIRTAIAEARSLAQSQSAPRQTQLFPGDQHPEQVVFDLRGLNHEQFWLAAEQRIYEALEAYAEQAENGGGFQRRLFADDAAQGFAFIDLCRKRYDVVVMNPPFGEATKRLLEFLTTDFPQTKHDLYAAFTERALALTVDGGFVGEISSRVGFFIKSFEKWRTEVMAKRRIECVVDLGFGVLDGATVEAACYVVSKSTALAAATPVARLLTIEDREAALSSCVADLSDPRWFALRISQVDILPLAPWIYWVSSSTLRILANHNSLEPQAAVVRQGLGTGDNNRFIRALWEVPPDLIASARDNCANFRKQFDNGKRWSLHVRSGSSQPWYSPLTVVIDWERQGLHLKEHWRNKGESPSRYVPSEDLYFRPGFSWTLRAFRLIPCVIPAGCIPSASRYMAFPKPGSEVAVLGFAASNIASAFMRFYGEMFERPKHLVDTVKRLPYVVPPPELENTFTQSGNE